MIGKLGRVSDAVGHNSMFFFGPIPGSLINLADCCLFWPGIIIANHSIVQWPHLVVSEENCSPISAVHRQYILIIMDMYYTAPLRVKEFLPTTGTLLGRGERWEEHPVKFGVSSWLFLRHLSGVKSPMWGMGLLTCCIYTIHLSWNIRLRWTNRILSLSSRPITFVDKERLSNPRHVESHHWCQKPGASWHQEESLTKWDNASKSESTIPVWS